jgi:hypothetical protein
MSGTCKRRRSPRVRGPRGLLLRVRTDEIARAGIAAPAGEQLTHAGTDIFTRARDVVAPGAWRRGGAAGLPIRRPIPATRGHEHQPIGTGSGIARRIAWRLRSSALENAGLTGPARCISADLAAGVGGRFHRWRVGFRGGRVQAAVDGVDRVDCVDLGGIGVGSSSGSDQTAGSRDSAAPHRSAACGWRIHPGVLAAADAGLRSSGGSAGARVHSAIPMARFRATGRSGGSQPTESEDGEPPVAVPVPRCCSPSSSSQFFRFRRAGTCRSEA